MRSTTSGYIGSGLLVGLLLCGGIPLSPRVDAAMPALLRVSRLNPHYLEYRGKPLLLVSSAEHYGAVINLDFDFRPYLSELKRHGLNQTRLWTGFYLEDPTAFNITNNTLAPAPNRYLAPWARSSTPGYANGGNKFDLSVWDPAFFARLRNYLKEAAARDIIVEIVLFCPFYEDSMWRISPLNAGNNVNGLGAGLTRQEVYALSDPRLVAFQDAYVRKIVSEANGFDNVYFELVNEPYTRDLVPDRFQRHVADLIVATEEPLGKRHLIAQGIANGSKKVEDPHPAVSIFNFHYAAPPSAIAMNDALGRVIADDETGFRGQADLPYRLEAWHFLLAGGGSFSHLDYSFTTAHPAGTWVPLPRNQPGGGGPQFRQQMRILADFMKGFEFVKMSPRDDVLRGSDLGDLQARALIEEGRQYAVYVSVPAPTRAAADRLQDQPSTIPARQIDLALALPAGRYEVQWIDPMTGRSTGRERFDHSGGSRRLRSASFTTDIAVRLVSR